MARSKKKRTKKNRGQNPTPTPVPTNSPNSVLDASMKCSTNEKDCATDPATNMNGKGQQVQEDDAIHVPEVSNDRGFGYEDLQNSTKPQDSASNAGSTSSSFLRQAAANKAATDARNRFREKRHRAELEKVKAGHALETVKDEEEGAANDAIMKVALQFEQGINEETLGEWTSQNEYSKELWARENEQNRLEAQRASKRISPLEQVYVTPGRKTPETITKKLTFEDSVEAGKEMWRGHLDARHERTGSYKQQSEVNMQEYYYKPRPGRYKDENACGGEEDAAWQNLGYRPRPEDENRSEMAMLINALRAPQVTIPTFSGDPLEYHPFIHAFEESVERFVYDNGSRLTSLMAHCSGEPARLIKGCSQLPAHKRYREARRLLEQRYGNEFRISMMWIEKVTEIQGRPSLRELADMLRTCQIAVDAMGSTCLINYPENLRKIVAKLSTPLQDRWARIARDVQNRQNRPPLLEDLVRFIEEEAELIHDPVFGRNAYKRERNNQPANFGVMATTKCNLCEGGHETVKCHKFIERPYEERMEAVKVKRLCFNCLNPGHSAQKCGSYQRCERDGCGRKHATLLHIDWFPNQPGAPQESSYESELQVEHSEPVHVKSSYITGGKIALPIVAIKVKAPGSTKEIKTYALLDSGSTHSFCSEALLKELGMKGKNETLYLSTIEKADSRCRSQVVTLEVSGMEGQEGVTLPCVYSKQRLPFSSENIATIEDIAEWPHLCGLPIPMAEINDVALLIGQDCPDVLMPLDMIKGGKGEPYATRTMLGWTLNGPLRGKGGSMSSYACSATEGLQALSSKVDRFWQLESSGLYEDKKEMSIQDKDVLRKWQSEATFENGHYTLPIPFKNDLLNLPNSRPMAEVRLKNLGRKLERNEDLKQKYAGAIQDLLDKGYAIKVPEEEINREDGKVWYLPHHPVINPNKEKIRIVFDCAAECRRVSLNNQVLQGPDLTNSLVGVLTRFRLRPVAFMADIEAMFHQVKVVAEDQDVLRFLWWSEGDTSQDAETYRMTVHLFGGTWSPSCCTYALHEAAKDATGVISKEVQDTILHDFYVDDCLKSVDTVEEAKEMYQCLKGQLKTRGFNLTKWTSNHPEMMDYIPMEERSKAAKERVLDTPLEERALGVYWNVEEDTLGYKIGIMGKPLTKRGLLSMLSSIYDPLGLASPFILRARKIVQELCRKGAGWDESIPKEQEEQWKAWTADLENMKDIKFPRCTQPSLEEGRHSVQLHHFADASEVAYGVASYLRIENNQGEVKRTLVMAKSRLAPIKQQTIPRLELCAATLAARQDALLRQEMDTEIEESYFWTDSAIVLRYIQNEERRFQTFVANRVAEIRERTEVKNWRYVPTNVNPADDASRGISAKALNMERWLKGPEFLQQRKDEWPEVQFVPSISNDDLEVKRESHAFMVCSEEGPLDKLAEHYSSYARMLRGVAWLQVFRDMLRKKIPPPKRLEAEHVRSAEETMLKHLQKKAYGKELQTLNDGGEVHSNSSLAPLKPILKDGLMRVGGRLKNAMLSEEICFPVILPSKGSAIEALIRHVHKTTAHAGREYVMAQLRQRYWVIGGRTTVRQVLRECVECKKRAAVTVTQQMADLPEDRLAIGEPAFTRVGVDYFGPFPVKRGRGTEKRYGCLFTCLVSRAIHIEIAHSLDTDSFINCLQRFMARRGQPKVMRSDNGTNFVGADREIRREIEKWNKERIQQQFSERFIEWKFNPPQASHMGGVWERQIRTIRRVLAGLTTEQVLTDEMLATLMCIAEGIVNNRPITTVSDDPSDMEPLTPNHLLLLRPVTAVPGLFSESDMYSRRKWRQVQYLADLFWRRWTKEYLPLLQKRGKWQRERRNVKEGDIVLVVDKMQPRNEWMLGRIVEAFKGLDDRVRSVRIKTKNGECIRPISKVCMLEEVKN